MNQILVLVESPNKCQTISSFLPSNYKVVASVGHISEIKDGGDYHNTGISPDEDFDANFAISDDKKDIVARLKKLVKESDLVYICSDPDREGEAIAWSLKKFLNIPKSKCKRATFQEINKKAVLDALNNPRDIDENLVDAAHARMKLDKMLGYRMSPIARRSIRARSVGRCQSAGLLLIAQKEHEIQEFVPEEYSELILNFSIDDESFKAKYQYFEEDNKKLSVAKGRNILSHCNDLVSNFGQHYKVTNIETKQRFNNPSPAFSTATFLQEASNRLGMSVETATSCAQKLFEGLEVNHQHVGLITYIRTDSTEISQEFLPTLESFVKRTYGERYYAPTRVGKKNELAQEGHEALRVIDLEMTPEKLSQYIVDKNLLKVYNIIYQRTIASSMASSITRETIYTISLNDYNFKLISKELLFDGYKKVYKFEDKEENLSKHIFNLDEDITQYNPQLKLEEKKTQPPARYKEASFLSKLESSGIGRPSTYKTIVKTLLDESRGYCEIVDKFIVPTQKGLELCDFLTKNYSGLVSIDYTKEMEEDLDLIAQGKLSEVDFLNSFYNLMESIIGANNGDVRCPICGNSMTLRKGKFGRFYGCNSFPSCKGIRKYEC